MKKECVAQQELFKIKREIERNGETYQIYQNSVDEYNQPTNEVIQLITAKGLLHEVVGYKSKQSSYPTTTHTEKQPMILFLYDDIKDVITQKNLFVVVNNKRYNIVAFENVQEMNIVLDVSLRVVIDGNKN